MMPMIGESLDFSFSFLVFKQQCKASIEQFLYIFNHAAEGQHEQIIIIIVVVAVKNVHMLFTNKISMTGRISVAR